NDPRSADPLYRFDTVDRHGFTSAVTVGGTAMAWQPQARVHVTTRDEDSVRTVPLIPDIGDTQARALSARAVGIRADRRPAFAAARPLTLRLGLDFAREHLDTTYRRVNAAGAIGALSSATAGDRARIGLFATAFWDPTTRVRLTAGTRWDDIDDSGFQVTAIPA